MESDVDGQRLADIAGAAAQAAQAAGACGPTLAGIVSEVVASYNTGRGVVDRQMHGHALAGSCV